MISILDKTFLLERIVSNCRNVIKKQIAHGLGLMLGKPYSSLYYRPKGVKASMQEMKYRVLHLQLRPLQIPARVALHSQGTTFA
jgi:hypothetical protein